MSPGARGALRAVEMCLALLIVGCGESPERASSPRPAVPPRTSARDEASFVGRAACVACHPNAVAAWTGSHHDLAMGEPEPLGRRATLTTTRGRWTLSADQRSAELASSGARVPHAIAFRIGTEPLAQFVARGDGGRMQILPFALDTRGEGALFAVTDDDVSSHDAAFNWNHACVECHATNVRKGFDEATERFDTTFSEIDVSCEACHGPASSHVDWARGRAREDAARGFAFTLRGSGPSAWARGEGAAIATRAPSAPTPNELDVCGRCHARRRPIHEVDLHGAPLLDTYVPELAVPPFYFVDGQIHDEVFEYGSFLQSRMHAAGVTCTDCHEPHRGTLRAEGNALCATCHEPAVFDTPAHHRHAIGSAGAACVSCHMPQRTYMQIDPRRDHSLRIPRPDLSVSLGVPNACQSCHEDIANTELAATVTRWRAGRPPPVHYGEVFAHARAGTLEDAASLYALVDPREGASVMTRATAASLLGAALGPADRTRTLTVLRAALTDGQALVRLGALRATLAQTPPLRWQLAGPRLEDPVLAVRIEAAHVLMDTQPPSGTRERAALDRATTELLATTRLNADRADARALRAEVFAARGDSAGALREYAVAMRLDPRYWPAYANAADLHRALGDEAEALALLDRGIGLVPESAELHHARGLALVRAHRYAEAREALATAVRLAPGDARLHTALELAERALRDQ